MTENNEQLNKNKTDLMASTAKSVLGGIPFAGALLSELVENLIPNQSIDRLSKYVAELDKKLSRYDQEHIRKALDDDECIDLFEEGFFQASRALTGERRSYIASIIEKGLEKDHIAFSESKHLLRLLQELNDIEVIWLRLYLVPTIGGDKEFREKHKDILEPVRAHVGADESVREKAAFQDSYKEHIERIELIKAHYRLDRNTGLPEFDKFSGKPKASYKDLTSLGRLLLKQLGLLEDENG